MSAQTKLGSSVQCPVCHVSHLPQQKDVKSGVFAATCQNCGHFFKFKVDSGLATEVTLTVNGQKYTVSTDKYSSSTSLNSFLRTSRASMGTKVMCREGGCGMCVVEAKLYEPISFEKRAYSINSCLYPVFLCDGWEITTVEGISHKGDNSVSERLAHYNGSQCGYCSDGQVMNMHSLLEYNGGQVTMQQVEDAFDNVICRCTGYRPILDAMKSFAVDSPANKKKAPCSVDIEDVGTLSKVCSRTGGPCRGNCSPQTSDNGEMTQIVLKDAQWFKPKSVDQVFVAMKQAAGKTMKLVFGNTGFGVFGELGQWMFEVLIDLREVQELYGVDFDSDVVLGANLSVNQLQDIFYRGKSEPNLYYFDVLYKRVKEIAGHSVRNLGCWAGNLMLKHAHPEFPSDVYCMLEAAGAQLNITDGSQTQLGSYDMSHFLALDMTGKLITGMMLPGLDTNDYYIRTYNVSKRAQNAHAYVNAGFRMRLDSKNNFLVKERPTLVFGGISATFNHATNTETFLVGKQLTDPSVFKAALMTLFAEVVPDTTDLRLASATYRKTLALSYFYRFVLDVLGEAAPARLRTGAKALTRPLSSGLQSYDTKTMEWPLTQPMTKVLALNQTSGKAVYINDIPSKPQELHAAFVRSTVANATLQGMDATGALSTPGVVKFLEAKDIPGVNNCYPLSPWPSPEELFCSGQVSFAGQPLGLIIAEDEQTARSAANKVKVTYTNIQPPIVTMADAISKKSIFPGLAPEFILGDAEAAISNSPQKIQGSISCGPQYHFQMETQVSIATPTEDGIDIDASTQWPDFNLRAVAMVLGCYENRITVRTKRLGGAYGAKITRNAIVSAAVGLAAQVTNRPVRMNMEFHTNMETIGKRFPYMANYQVGCSDTGVLNGVKITYYADCGYLPSDHALPVVTLFADNAYYCQNWHLIPVGLKTNKPMNTAARSPGSCPSIFITESIMEHLAKALNMDPTEVRRVNLYQKNQLTPYKQPLLYCNISTLLTELETLADVSQRKKSVVTFNQNNRWRKKGLSIVPMKFEIFWEGGNYNCLVDVYQSDGSVIIDHGGIECGQGINTKTIQVCAYKLGISIDMIRVVANNTVTNAGSVTTGGSITSELCCQAIANCCDTLLARIAPVKAKMPNAKWKDLIQQCASDGIDLTARYWTSPTLNKDVRAKYFSYGVTCSEMELDVLTGQYQISRVDLLYDCGESLNPEIDIGQVEGAFVMGLGYWLTEEQKEDPTTGVLLTNNTWEYKPPLGKDIPIDFRVHLLKNAPNPLGVLRSKASGEPPLCMSCSALFALKHAAEAAREEIGQNTFFPLNGPATVEKINAACLLNPDQMVLTA
ncbi:xanthine dehydrogenase-like [Mizuhopecten yessoensis]|uniref:xanthine dehydrogenase-like n=1 Tax=Mizuhopecten yessoensis TaxID=6573 RepID=UPI000B4577BF|nr:xanthine dehydrogenase-like [Mizuhopecten yessoensis]